MTQAKATLADARRRSPTLADGLRLLASACLPQSVKDAIQRRFAMGE